MATAPKGKRMRRMTDIDRLAEQYNRSINELTGQYETSFSDYQKQVSQQMAPFEEAAAKYRTETLPTYERQLQDFQKRMSAYQQSLAEIEKNPFEAQKIRGSFRHQNIKKAGSADPYEWGYVIDGTWRSARALPEGYVEEKEGGEFALKKKAIPTFTEKAPTAPTAPTVSGAAAFDSSQFEQRRGQLQEELGRELGERRAGKLAAVSRRSRRPMLQEA
jgi:hypothetical protein